MSHSNIFVLLLFNAASTVFQLYTADSAPNHKVPGFLTPVLSHNSFPVTDYCLTLSMRGEKSPERMFAQTGNSNPGPLDPESIGRILCTLIDTSLTAVCNWYTVDRSLNYNQFRRVLQQFLQFLHTIHIYINSPTMPF